MQMFAVQDYIGNVLGLVPIRQHQQHQQILPAVMAATKHLETRDVFVVTVTIGTEHIEKVLRDAFNGAESDTDDGVIRRDVVAALARRFELGDW